MRLVIIACGSREAEIESGNIELLIKLISVIVDAEPEEENFIRVNINDNQFDYFRFGIWLIRKTNI